MQDHIVLRKETNLGKAISSAFIALSSGTVPVKPAPEMTSFVHHDILGHSDWHRNTEQLPHTNPVASLQQKKDPSQRYEWLFTHLQKEMQCARQQRASIIHSLISKVLTGKPQGIVLIGNGQRLGVCSIKPACSSQDTDKTRFPCIAPDVYETFFFFQFFFHISKEWRATDTPGKVLGLL